jgi:hypothetical protein
MIYFLLFQSVSAIGAKMTIHNNCKFGIKPLMMGGQALNTLPPQGEMSLTAPFAGSRLYFGPEDWISSGDNHEKLGFLEFNAGGDSIHINPSMVNFFGLPMTFVGKKDGKVFRQSGCDSSNYQGFEHFQEVIKNHCPGKVEKLNSSTELYSCKGTYNSDIDGTKVDTTWDLDADIASSNMGACPASALGSGTHAKNTIGNCQSCLFGNDQKAGLCAALNRGDDSHDASKFFSKPSPYDPTATDKKWQFNPYAAFVHMTCGPNIFAFPTDDQGGHGGYFDTWAGEEAVITLCPAAGSGPNSPGIMPSSNSSTNDQQDASDSNDSNDATDSTSTTTPNSTTSDASTTDSSTTDRPTTDSSTTDRPSTDSSTSDRPSTDSSTGDRNGAGSNGIEPLHPTGAGSNEQMLHV